MWVEFVVGSRPSSEGFSLGSPVFLPPQKPTFPNFNSTRTEDPHENQLRLMCTESEEAQPLSFSFSFAVAFCSAFSFPFPFFFLLD